MSEPEQLDLLDWLAALPPYSPAAAPVEPVSLGSGTPPDPAPVHLTRVDTTCNLRRFYGLAYATSLFGEHGVVRRWGRIGTAGQSRTDWYDEPSEAQTALQTLLRAKRRRGYAP